MEQSSESGFVELNLPAETDSGSHPITAVPIPKPEPSQLTLSVCGITIQVTEDTSPALLARTIGVIMNAQ